MGLFDGMVASTFRRDTQGRVYFAPLGSWGQTYLVPPEREVHLSRFLRAYYAIMLAVTVVAVQVVGWRVLWLVPLELAGLYAKYWHFTHSLQVAPTHPPPVSRGELLATQARATGRPLLAGMLVVSLLFTAAGVWMIRSGTGRDGYLVAAFFALCALMMALQLYQARR